MLILSRKQEERVAIGSFGFVKVVDLRKSVVKLAFDFDHRIPVHREEVFAAMLDEIGRQLPPTMSEEDCVLVKDWIAAEISAARAIEMRDEIREKCKQLGNMTQRVVAFGNQYLLEVSDDYVAVTEE